MYNIKRDWFTSNNATKFQKHLMTRLVLNRPVRELKTSRRCLTGRVSLYSGGTASFESSLERDWLIALDFDPCVCAVLEQPFSIQYEWEGQIRRYTPDILAESIGVDGRYLVTVYEVKPLEELRSNWQSYKPRFRAAMRHCRAIGWKFKIVTEREIRTPFVTNAKFLRRYRYIKPQPLIAAQLLYSLKALGETTPQALLAAAYLPLENQMAAVPELWRLVANRQIVALLDESLTMQSPIWHAGD
jgi:hypothetical protein